MSSTLQIIRSRNAVNTNDVYHSLSSLSLWIEEMTPLWNLEIYLFYLFSFFVLYTLALFFLENCLQRDKFCIIKKCIKISVFLYVSTEAAGFWYLSYNFFRASRAFLTNNLLYTLDRNIVFDMQITSHIKQRTYLSCSSSSSFNS